MSTSIRGVYGGVPTQLFERGLSLRDVGINAIWIGSGGLSAEGIALARSHGAEFVFAEFNTMHEAGYLKDHPDASPVGTDGKICPPPDGWQGVCPTHPDYRRSRMEAFRATLRDHVIDGIWLDYHHSHASWEQAVPKMPDTCFCTRCLTGFAKATKTALPEMPTPEISRFVLTEHRARWVQWRCDVFTDWVREFRSVLNETRPKALLGTFHCPWTDTDFDGALRAKLAIDLQAQSPYIDVFSTMPYHARFGHANDPGWISRQTAWLGKYLEIPQTGKPAPRIWPIVQLSDWGEQVPVSQVEAVLDHGTRPPSKGVMVFAWGSLHPQWEKVEAMGRFYRSIRTAHARDVA